MFNLTKYQPTNAVHLNVRAFRIIIVSCQLVGSILCSTVVDFVERKLLLIASIIGITVSQLVYGILTQFSINLPSLLTSPLILIVILGSMYGCYKIKQAATPITVFKKQLNTNQQCLVVNLATAPLLYLVGAGAVMFWVMGASAFVVMLHAAFYNIDALVTEETEGFLAETV